MKNARYVLFCLALLPLAVGAQTNRGQSLDQIFDQMHREMLKGMPGGKVDTIRLSPGTSQFFQMSPDSSSYFYFKVDTSFGGGAMPDLFRMDPFGSKNGNDSLGDFWGFDQMFKQMEDMQRQFFGMPPGTPAMPEEPNDGLLPEERLRLKEEQAQPGAAAPTPPAAPAKPKIKTTRI